MPARLKHCCAVFCCATVLARIWSKRRLLGSMQVDECDLLIASAGGGELVDSRPLSRPTLAAIGHARFTHRVVNARLFTAQVARFHRSRGHGSCANLLAWVALAHLCLKRPDANRFPLR